MSRNETRTPRHHDQKRDQMRKLASDRDISKLLFGVWLEEVDGGNDESQHRQARRYRTEHDPIGRCAGTSQWQQGQETQADAEGSQDC